MCPASSMSSLRHDEPFAANRQFQFLVEKIAKVQAFPVEALQKAGALIFLDLNPEKIRLRDRKTRLRIRIEIAIAAGSPRDFIERVVEQESRETAKDVRGLQQAREKTHGVLDALDLETCILQQPRQLPTRVIVIGVARQEMQQLERDERKFIVDR